VIKTTKSTELPVRTVTMVADIWIQVFVVTMPDIPVKYDDIQCEDSKGLSADSLLLRSYNCTGRELNIFRFLSYWQKKYDLKWLVSRTI